MNPEVRADLLQQIATLDRYQSLMALTSRQIMEGAFALPEIGDDVRAIIGDTSELEAYVESMKGIYGSCVDRTVLDRLPREAAS